VEPEDAGTANGSTGQRCAVVYNPIKISEELRDAISQQLLPRGGLSPSGWKPVRMNPADQRRTI
jgi:hypothetical protein